MRFVSLTSGVDARFVPSILNGREQLAGALLGSRLAPRDSRAHN